jgi:hypothetical protein
MRKIFILATLALAFATSCGDSPDPIEKRQLEAPNPTSYDFAVPLQELRTNLLLKIDDFSYLMPFHESFSGSGYSFVEETSEDASFGEHIFENPANVHDVFLHSYGAPINSPSPVYFSRGEPLEYFVDFQIHFEALDKNNTRVSIITHRPRVSNGTKCCSPHGQVAIFQDVEPTTIEEYRLLQLIGRIAGTQGMPPVRLPIEKD